jgi:hypothetical protein
MQRLALPLLLALLAPPHPGGMPDSRSSPAPRSPARAGAADPGNELVVIATDFKFQAPDQVEAGLVNIRLFNRGREMHHVLVIKVDRLDRISRIAEELKNTDEVEPWMHSLGGPESVGPGGVSSASMILEPGRYVLACVVASPTSHRMHFMDGMLKELAVVKPLSATAPAKLPAAELSLKLSEWSFTISGAVHAGRRTFRVENAGKLEHHAWIVRLQPGVSALQAVRWADHPTGAAPFEPVGGTTGLEAKRSVNVTVDLMPGEYVIICSLYNPLSKKTHSAMGMVKAFTVTD